MKWNKLSYLFTLLLIVCRAYGQNDYPPNFVAHASCNILLHKVEPLDPATLQDFITGQSINLKLAVYDNEPRLGPETFHANLLFIETPDLHKVFPTPAAKTSYQQKLSALLGQLQGSVSDNANNLILFTDDNPAAPSVTYLHFTDSKVTGYLHPVSPDKDVQKTLALTLQQELQFVKDQHQQLVWCGEPVALDIWKQAAAEQQMVFRRPTGVNRPLPVFTGPESQDFDPKSATVINAIPSSRTQLMRSGLAASRVNDWIAYKNEVENLLNDQFSATVTGKEAFKKELLSGNGDDFILVAHLKDNELYIGDDKITLDEIRSWGKRTDGKKGRKAYLFVCNAANEQYSTGHLFWKRKMDPLASILLDNNYFDLIVAPDHTILRPETTQVIAHLLINKSVPATVLQQPHWRASVFLYHRNHPSKHSAS